MATINNKSDTAIDSTPHTVESGQQDTTNATTEFLDDANVVRSENLYPTTIPRDLYMSNEDNYIQDIKTFLAKPQILRQSSFTNADSATHFPNISMPSTFLQIPLVANKISGYFGIRATMVFRIVFNATRFDMGRYIMAFIHTGGVNTTGNGNCDVAVMSHMATLVQRTQLPHVEFDLNCDTSAELTIPYLSAFNHTPLQNGFTYGDIGVIHISPYSKIQNTAATPDVGFTLYAHLTDVEIFGAARPQSISQKEANSNGRVSSVLTKIKQFTDVMKNFPTMSSYAEPASWVLDISANAAKAVGWSKPVIEMPTHRVVRDVAPFMFNVDAVDTSKVNALTLSNAVSVLPGFSGTDIDELAVSHIASRKAWFGTKTWTTETSVNANLATLLVAPYDPNYIKIVPLTAGGGFNSTSYTPLQFVSKYFKYWRGSIVYKFKFVKTEFHSGRLMFAFFLNDTAGAATSVSATQTAYVHRAIVDIREHNEYTFTIPFMSNTPYRDNQNASSIGTLTISVVDQLRAPDTVPSECQILMEHAGGPDIEFAVPINVGLTPLTGATPQSVRNDCSLGDDMLGSSSGIVHTLVNSEACIGERILSFRQLLKTYQTQVFQTAPTSQPFFNILPFGVPVQSDDTILRNAATNADLYTTMSGIFLFSRGSVRYKIIGASASNTNPAICTNEELAPNTIYNVYAQVNASNISGNTLKYSNRISVPNTAHANAQQGFIEVQVPQYNKVHSRINSDHFIQNPDVPYYTGDDRTTTPLGINAWSSGNFVAGEASMMRSMGDDGNFGHFISIMPMMLNGYYRQI